MGTMYPNGPARVVSRVPIRAEYIP
jgi:hypothetical protein